MRITMPVRSLGASLLGMMGLLLVGSGALEEARAQTGYYIINAHSGKCLDAAGSESGAPVVQWFCNRGANQQWVLGTLAMDPGDGSPHYHQFVNGRSGGCLDIPAFSQSNGARLQQYTCNGGDNQFFQLEEVLLPLDSQMARLKAFHSRKCLDVPYDASSKLNGVQVQQYDCNTGLNQEWLLVPAF